MRAGYKTIHFIRKTLAGFRENTIDPQPTPSLYIQKDIYLYYYQTLAILSLPPQLSMPILNSENIPAGSAFDQRNSWLPLDKFRTLNRSRVCYEAHGHGLLAFTSAVCEENFDQACLDKNLVNTLYTVEVMDRYGGPGGPEATKLLS